MIINKINSLPEAVQHFIYSNMDTHIVFKQAGAPMGTKGPICNILDIFVNDTAVRRYYVFFKREWLHAFKHLFNKPKEGFGQTINLDILKQAAGDKKNPTIAVVMPDSCIYYIKAQKMLRYVLENNTIRTPSTEASKEASIPARLFSSVDGYYDSHG